MSTLTVTTAKIDSVSNSAGNGPITIPYGVKFSNSLVADVNTLNWYEEGAWTPVFTSSTPGTLSITYTTQWGQFTRIGRQVTANFKLGIDVLTLGTASGSLLIGGLPYPNSSSGFSTGSCMWDGIDTGGPQTTLYLDVSASSMYAWGSNDNGVWSAPPISNLSSGDLMIGSITYFVS